MRNIVMDLSRINFKAIVRIVLFRFTAFVFLLFFAGSLMAQQIRIHYNYKQQRNRKGRCMFRLQFVVENAKQIDRLSPPAFPDFHVVEGPMQSSGMSIVNGNMSQYKGVSFVLQPNKTGSFTIQGATAEVDGKAMRSNSVTIEVTTNSTGNSGNINPLLMPSMPREEMPDDKDYILRPGENIVEKTKKNLFVKVQVDKNSCYVGEPIVATYKLYSRVRSEVEGDETPIAKWFQRV